MKRVLWATAALWLGTNAVQAAETTIRDAQVESVSAWTEQPRDCAIRLDRAIRRAGDRIVDCPGQSVAIQCASLDLAMLAFNSCRPLDVRVSDATTVNGLCVAKQVWVKRRASTGYRSRYEYGDCDDDYYDDDDDDDDDDDRWDDD